MKIQDTRPQVGIFEIVDGILFIDTEDVQPIDQGGGYFDGLTPHLHNQDIQRQVVLHPSISEEMKSIWKSNRNEYLNHPRGRVDFDTINNRFEMMAAYKFFTNENVNRIARAFHLNPEKIVLVADDGHYGY